MEDERFLNVIPLELAEALFGFATPGEFAVYTAILSSFPTLRIPEDFVIIGSAAVKQNMKVGLATFLNKEEALSSFASALFDADWLELPIRNPIQRSTGFVYKRIAKPSGRLFCHEDWGQLSINFREREPRNLVVLSSHIQQRNSTRSCAEVLAEEKLHESIDDYQHGGSTHMPILNVPEFTEATPFSLFWSVGSFTSKGLKSESEAQIEIIWPIGKVYRHFSEQLLDQNWTLDTEFIEEVSAVGSWIKHDNEGQDVLGTLSVTVSNKNKFGLNFSIETPGRGGDDRASIVRIEG